MKRAAFFVEGQAEQIFIFNLITHIAERKNLRIVSFRNNGWHGVEYLKRFSVENDSQDVLYEIKILNCAQDEKVKSAIIEQYDDLVKDSYTYIIGIRDVYPKTDINRLKANLMIGLPDGAASIAIILAVQEIEAWFIAEEHHYSYLSSNLSAKIANTVIGREIPGFDVARDSTERIACPSKTLQNIYATDKKAHIGYTKTEKQVKRIMQAMDFENLRLDVRNRNHSFNELMENLDGLFNEGNNQA